MKDAPGNTRAGRRRPRRPRRGYVLIVTLGLLVLAAGLLVAVGRATLAHAVRARLAEEELQRRWGTASCRDALLPYSEPILAALEERQRRPVPICRATVVLGGQQFELTLSDEQAKANVNLLLAGLDDPAGEERSRAEDRLRQALAGSGLGNRVRLHLPVAPAPRPRPSTRPAGGPSTGPDEAPAFWPAVDEWVSGFGQVFDGVPPQQLLARPGGPGGPGGPAAAAELLTCWGGGAINARRAPARALQLAAGTTLSRLDLERLVEARDRSYRPADARPAGAVSAAGAAPKFAAERDRIRQRLAVERLRHPGAAGAGGDVMLAATSACHSLWVVVRDKRRRWYTLTVLDQTDEARPRWEAFSW